MEELEKLVYEILGRSTKKELCKSLGITFPTLDSRLKKGGWTKLEIDFIKNIYVDQNGVIQDKRDLLF